MIDDSAMPNTTGANGTDVGRSNFRRAVDIFRHSFRPQWPSPCRAGFLSYCGIDVSFCSGRAKHQFGADDSANAFLS